MAGSADSFSGSIQLDKFQNNDFGIGTEAQGWSPSARTARGEDLHFADAAEAVNELAVDAARHPAPRNELSDVRVAGELKRISGGLGDFGMIGGVGQKDAGTIAVERNGAQRGREISARSCVAVRNADDLESIDVDAFILENTDARCGDSVEIFAVVPELLVIARDEINSMRRGELAERRGGAGGINSGAVE